ncbi:polysaccharide biosynthesis tyrosine autokinase [Flaviaesturariibacter flavus]|uniref:Polysaccharide biosynthesis tyrosine autokinase n=1 Tax=Flaviaesturariibacter flavus TaxID=2502780 RepID=A0A4R1BAZ2_9BACT|nr:polysaccharide biosynthesis tyrosine autokinase [Flaviaesturariibacter flavus]TCJ14166.1 polysaccharide biosynthesis tyrosine autokinase [Flaviaesturariibacter flavus]
MSSNFQATRSDQTGFNLKEFLFKYLRFLPLFILSLVLSLIIAFFYLRYTAPTFQSRGALILTEDKAAANSADKFNQLFVDDRSKNMANELEYLHSKALMQRVVADLGLNTQYYSKGKIKQLNVYKDSPYRLRVLSLTDSASSFDLHMHFIKGSSFYVGENSKEVYTAGQPFTLPQGTFVVDFVRQPAPGTDYLTRWMPEASMAMNLANAINPINKAGSSGIIQITMEADNAVFAADVINKVMLEYQESIKEDKNQKTRQTLAFLNGRLAIVNREVDSITALRDNFMRVNKLSDINAVSDKAYERSNESLKEMQATTLQLSKIGMIESYIRDGNRGDIVPTTLDLPDVTLNSQVQKYNDLQLEYKTLTANGNTPSGNATVRQLEEQIEKTRRNILETLRNVRAAYQTANQQLAGQKSSAEMTLSGLPSLKQRLEEINRALESKLQVFAFLNEKKEETAISLAATISNTRVLEQAEINRAPVRPTSGKVRSIALLIGLLIPLIFVLVLEILDDKITSRVDIERQTGTPIMGEVGHAGAENTLVVKARSRSFIAEQFRIARSNMQYVLPDKSCPVLMVTSSFSGEGKSFISTNIGAVMALAGKKTVVLEFDVRKPKILSGLGMAKKPGLTNFMLGKATAAELLVPVDGIDNYWVLPCGPIPPNPAELLLDPKLNELFDYLKANFDFIVMDTPPVGMVGDAMTLAKYVDATLYIVRQGVTHKKQLEMVNDFYKSEKLPKMNIILNDVKLRAGYGYYGYGRYGYGYGSSYGYGYGYGYYDDDVEGTSFIKRWFGWALPAGSRKRKKKQEKAG